MNRRTFLKTAAAGTALGHINLLAASADATPVLSVDPAPQFDLSPHLFMQFMEPLGTTDGSVSAAWDYKQNTWRQDVIDVTRQLSPSMMRWGGCLSSYYRWKEAVGPRSQRKPMHNLLWGGMEPNQVGTAEFVDFCKETQSEPLMCVNFESDGRRQWMKDPAGESRFADAAEAAEWVRYCNDPANKLRIEHGHKEPHPIKMWQIGNETSYDRNGYDCDTAAAKTIEFSKAMRKADPDITLIGWGDSGWAPRMLETAGEHLQYIAFHHMFDPYHNDKNSPLRDLEYRKDPARTWDYLMNAVKPHREKIDQMRQQVRPYNIPLAMTECHFTFQGRNRCEVLSTWAAGVAYARLMNCHIRNGDLLKIATLADFCGTRWQVNAVMIPVPGGKSFMMPVGRIMSFYRRHLGGQAVAVTQTPDGLDVTASRTGNQVRLHVINTHRARSVTCRLAVEQQTIQSGKVWEMAADPMHEVIAAEPDLLTPREKTITGQSWTFPPASLSMVSLTLQR
jgi:alpha-L-arabinofuranosidase